jgi:uncharacterized protein (DUF2384 family)
MTSDTHTINDDEAEALARSIVNLARLWKLSDAEVCLLLGGIPAAIWAKWDTMGANDFNDDLRIRMAHLVGIHICIRKLFNEASRAYAWLRAPNEVFQGRAAIDIMLSGETSDLAFMREWLNAETSR